MKTKNKFNLLCLAALITLIVSCKKDTAPQLDPSTSFILNGTSYHPRGMSYADFGGGYVDCFDTSISSDGNRILIIDMSFQIAGGKPPTGSYGVFTDSVGFVTANHVEFYLYEFTKSNKTINSYDIVPPGNGTVDITNLSNRISVKFGTQTLRGVPYDTNTSVSNGPYFNCNLSAATLTEQ